MCENHLQRAVAMRKVGKSAEIDVSDRHQAVYGVDLTKLPRSEFVKVKISGKYRRIPRVFYEMTEMLREEGARYLLRYTHRDAREWNTTAPLHTLRQCFILLVYPFRPAKNGTVKKINNFRIGHPMKSTATTIWQE